MTDQQIFKDDFGTELLEIRPYRELITVRQLIDSREGSIALPAARLLAMIDAADPDAMRAYLRETAPEVIADLYRPEIPEADSPEDIDEHAVIELSDDIDTRLHVIERLAKILRAGTDAVEVCTLADWVIDR